MQHAKIRLPVYNILFEGCRRETSRGVLFFTHYDIVDGVTIETSPRR